MSRVLTWWCKKVFGKASRDEKKSKCSPLIRGVLRRREGFARLRRAGLGISALVISK